MQLKALRYFLTVAATGSFLAAARQYSVPASSVSRFIAALEKELGKQLLYRSTRAVRLTEAGERFHHQVRDALEILDQAAEQMEGKDAGISGLIRINAPESLGRRHIAPIIAELQELHPALVVELTLTDLYIDPVQDGVDITIRIGPLVDSGLIGKVISPNRHQLVASPAYLKAHGTPETPEDLLQHRCLVYKGQLGMQRWYVNAGDEQPLKVLNVTGPLRSNNAEALLAAAVAGRGIVLFPDWMFEPGTFARGDMVKLLPQWQFSTQPDQVYLQMLSPENKMRSRKVQTVSAFILEAIGSPPYWCLDA